MKNQLDETDLIRLYVDLTGGTEMEARSTIMYVCYKELPEVVHALMVANAPEGVPSAPSSRSMLNSPVSRSV